MEFLDVNPEALVNNIGYCEKSQISYFYNTKSCTWLNYINDNPQSAT